MTIFYATNLIADTKALLEIDGHFIPKEVEKLGILYLTKKNTAEYCKQNLPQSPKEKSVALVFFRLLESKCVKQNTNIDITTLKAIHTKLFRGREGCGQLRTVNIKRFGAECMDYKQLTANLIALLNQMQSYINPESFLSKKRFAATLAHFTRELIILSPFIFGNGISIRRLLEIYASKNGFYLSYSYCPADIFFDAEKEVLTHGDIAPLTSALYKCLINKRQPLKLLK